MPRIADIEDATERIEDALRSLNHPAVDNNETVAVSVAHGRVPDAGKVVQAFSQGSNETRPVLLATSLVENGLDLPRCNTIVVQDAHMFGFASLHQLRGASVAGRCRPWPCSCILPIRNERWQLALDCEPWPTPTRRRGPNSHEGTSRLGRWCSTRHEAKWKGFSRRRRRDVR